VNFGEIQFEIVVFQGKRLKRAEGFLIGPRHRLTALLGAGYCTLQTDGGMRIDVVARFLDPRGEGLACAVSGPVPGF